MSEVFREWLSQELEQLNWSHRELARRTGLSQSIVSKTLSGERNPSLNFVTKVAAALNEPPDKLLRLVGVLSTSDDDPTFQELIDLARSLPPEEREELLNYARFRYQQRNS